MNTSVIDEVVEEMGALPPDLQRRVLQFARRLAGSRPQGVSGRKLSAFAGAIPADELQLMAKAIEQGCEQIDANEW